MGTLFITKMCLRCILIMTDIDTSTILFRPTHRFMSHLLNMVIMYTNFKLPKTVLYFSLINHLEEFNCAFQLRTI